MNFRTAILFCLFWIPFVHSGRAFTLADTTHPATPDTNHAKPHDITTIYTEPSVSPFNQWGRKSWTVDTTLYNFQDYTQQYNLGNTGSPYVPLLFSTNLNPIGFYYGHNYLEPQFYSDSTIKYYHTRAPYTLFFYVTDPMTHQFFHFIHTQNIGKNFNFALEFQRTRSEGTYVNQATNNNQLTLTMNYQVKRYALFIDGIYGTYELDQNGGLTADSNLGNSIYSNRLTEPVNLQQARTTLTEKTVHFKQYFYLGFHTNDSLHKVPALYISHSFRLATNTNVFSDPGPLNTSFYTIPYKDTSSTYDSLHYREITNDLSIGSAKGWPSFLRWEAGVTDQWVHYSDAHTDTVMNNLIVHACLYDTGRVLYNIQGKEIIAGSQQGDMQASAGIGIHLDSLRSIRMQGEYASQTPPLVYDLYYGNTDRWENHFSKTNTASASLIYSDTKWKLSCIVSATQLNNLTYFTTDGTPQQFNQGIQVFTACIKKDFKVGKWHLNTNNVYQYVTAYTPLHLPQFVLENSLYYENYFFHHNLLLKLGVEAYFNTLYYGYAYNPVVDQYYVENQTKLGNYWFINPFVSIRIKQFRFFLKLENAGSGIEQSTYFYVQGYPVSDRLLRMGISWDFWN